MGRVPLHRVSQRGRSVMVESSLAIAQLLVDYGTKVDDADNAKSTFAVRSAWPGQSNGSASA